MQMQYLKAPQAFESKTARSPTLQTVLMVEKFIEDESGEYTKTQVFKTLPRKVMWPTFQVIMAYLESINKIAYDKDGYVIIDISVEHLEYLVQRAKQIEQLNLKLEI